MSTPFPVGLYLPQNVAPELVFAWAKCAEAAGVHELWLPDHLHHFPDKRAGRLEAWTTLAALAAETSAIRLGIGVCNVQLRNPALLAKMAFTFDRLSYGRLNLVLGTGGNTSEAAAYGYAPVAGPRARRMLEEAIHAIRAFESGGPASAAEGALIPFADAYCHPPPRQQPFPLMVAADHPETMRLVARHADGWYANLGTADDFAARYARFAAIAEEEHRDMHSLQRSAHVLAILGRTPDDAYRAAAAYREQPRARLFEEPHIVGDAMRLYEGLAAYRAAGATRAAVYVLNLPACTEREGNTLIRLLARAAAGLNT